MALIEKNIEPSIALIKELSDLKECKVVGLSFLDELDVVVQKHDKNFDLIFNTRDYQSVEEARYKDLEDFQLIENGKTYWVSGKKSRFARLKDYWDERGFECTIRAEELYTQVIEPDASYYIRYMIPVEKRVYFTDFRGWGFKVGSTSFGGLMKINFSQGEVHFYTITVGEQSYLVVESVFLCSLLEIDKVAYSVLLAFGLISGTVHLNEAYMIMATTDDFRDPIGVYYKSLRDSIRCQYTIFTTNVYSVLMPIAKRMGDSGVEKKMLEKIEKKWKCAIEEMSAEVFTTLVLNLYQNDAIARATLLLLDSSTLTLELQPAAYCIAFETVCTALSKIYDLKSPKMLGKDVWDNSGIKKELLKVIDKGLEDGVLDDLQGDFLKGKINNMNAPANLDKLKLPFERFGYPLSETDITGIKNRNRFMHGILNTDNKEGETEADKLFFSSLLMHKLTCILILKHCGFNGYIIDNLVLHQKPNKKSRRSAFIKI